MSRSMRPESRRWGPSAGQFVDGDTAVELLEALSKRAPAIPRSFVEDSSSDSYRIRWEDGIGILRRFEALNDGEMTGAVLEVNRSRPEGLEEVNDALRFLQNLRSMTSDWESHLGPDDGSLELLLDA